jgi:hypothetical protein
MKILALKDVENINKFFMKPFESISKQCVIGSSWGINVESLAQSQNYFCVSDTQTFLCVCVCDAVCVWSQNILCVRWHKHVCDSIFGGWSGGVACSTPTDQKPSIPPIFVHIHWHTASKRKACQEQVGYSIQERNGRSRPRCKVRQRRIKRQRRVRRELEAVQ